MINGPELWAVIGLGITSLGTIVTVTWKFSSLATTLTATIHNLENKDKELENQIKDVKSIPELTRRIDQAENLLKEVPKIQGKILVLEQAAQFSKEMRMRQLRQSKPDNEENGGND